MKRKHAISALALFWGLATLLKLVAASHWTLLADEAYYWVWEQHLGWGYYDQPPLIAWLIALTTALLGEGEAAIRFGAIVCGLLAALLMLDATKDEKVRWLWWLAVPSLTWLTWTATSDAPLLAGWALAFAAAKRGERYWLLAGVGAGLAMLSKYTGFAVLPLLILGAGPKDWRSRWPYLGGVIALLVWSPNLVWNAQNDWVSFRFQFAEGLEGAAAPGLSGPLTLVLDQWLVLGPLLAPAAVWWAVINFKRLGLSVMNSETSEALRTERMAWYSVVPVVLFFGLAATQSTTEAHWPAIAYIGLGVGLSYTTGALLRLVHVGLWIGLAINGALGINSVHPFLPFEVGELRLAEGEEIARGVAPWAFPEGVIWSSENADKALVVYTERYQEASLIHYYLGIAAHKYPGCGRVDQYDLWDLPAAEEALYVRPATSGSQHLCTDKHFPIRQGPNRYQVIDKHGKRGKPREVFTIQSNP